MSADEQNHDVNATRVAKWLALLFAGILLTPAFMFFKLVDWIRQLEIIDDIAIFRLITLSIKAIVKHLHITSNMLGLGLIDRGLRLAEEAYNNMTASMIDWAGYGGERAYTAGIVIGVSGVVATISVFTGMGPVLLYALTPTTVAGLTDFLMVTAVGMLVIYSSFALRKLVNVGFKHTSKVKQALKQEKEQIYNQHDADKVEGILKVNQDEAAQLVAKINHSLAPPAEPVKPLRLLVVFLAAIPLAAFYIPVKLLKMVRRGSFAKDHLGLKFVRPLVGRLGDKLQSKLQIQKSPWQLLEGSYEFVEAYLVEWAGPGGKAVYNTGLAIGVLAIVAVLTYVSGTGPLLLAALFPSSGAAVTTMLAHVFSGVLVLYAGVAISQMVNTFFQQAVKPEHQEQPLPKIPVVKQAGESSADIQQHEGVPIQPQNVTVILADKNKVTPVPDHQHKEP